MRVIRILTLLSFFLASSGCSPFFVMRAGWEEAGILLRRRSIDRLVADPATEQSFKARLKLVLDARSFAQELTLEPGGSFSKYSQVDRDVLVWVLTAAPKTSLKPYLWWFPIVGSIPYKGYFAREDAIVAAEELQSEGYDAFVRGSPAYSTLGWFDDPLLSTIMKADDVALVDTVLHEILHNTVWVKDHADFNESLANFVGSRASAEFFKRQDGGESERYRLAEARWADELVFSAFLQRTIDKLKPIYESAEGVTRGSEREREIVAARELIFTAAQAEWREIQPSLQEPSGRTRELKLNNASILAYQTYLTKIELFDRLFQRLGRSFPRFISELRGIAKRVEDEGVNPYEELEQRGLSK